MKQGKRHILTLAWPEESGQCRASSRTAAALDELPYDMRGNSLSVLAAPNLCSVSRAKRKRTAKDDFNRQIQRERRRCFAGRNTLIRACCGNCWHGPVRPCPLKRISLRHGDMSSPTHCGPPQAAVITVGDFVGTRQGKKGYRREEERQKKDLESWVIIWPARTSPRS